MSFGQNYNIFNDLHDLEKLVGSLEGYLKSNQLYGSVGGGIFTGGRSPNLTVGAVRLRLRRIDALQDMLDARRQKNYDRIRFQHDQIHTDHLEAYLSKMERESHSRLDAMKQFFDDCNEDPKMCPRIYNPEIFRRTVIEELVTGLTSDGVVSEELDQKLSRTDKKLRRYVQPAEFQWDDQLREVYPKETFWWVWMQPAS